MAATWDQILTAEDRAVLERGKWAQRAGVGQRPALIVVDALSVRVRNFETAKLRALCSWMKSARPRWS